MYSKSISIIGGADGPTSIFVSGFSLWKVVFVLIFCVIFFGFAVYLFIKNMKSRKVVKSIVWGFALCVLTVLMIFNLFVLSQNLSVKSMLKLFNESQNQQEEKISKLFYGFLEKDSDEDFILFESLGTVPLSHLDKNYRKIISDKNNFLFLLQKSKSLIPTRYGIPNQVFPMTEGDIAICMILDMYEMSDDYFEKFLCENIKKENQSASDFWDYVHESESNRNLIVNKIFDFVIER